MEPIQILMGLGAGLLLGVVLDVARDRTQRLVASSGVALVLLGGIAALLTRDLGQAAVGVTVGLLLAIGVTAGSRLVTEYRAKPTDTRATG